MKDDGQQKNLTAEAIRFFGSETWIRTKIKGFRVPRPAFRRSRNIRKIR